MSAEATSDDESEVDDEESGVDGDESREGDDEESVVNILPRPHNRHNWRNLGVNPIGFYMNINI